MKYQYKVCLQLAVIFNLCIVTSSLAMISPNNDCDGELALSIENCISNVTPGFNEAWFANLKNYEHHIILWSDTLVHYFGFQEFIMISTNRDSTYLTHCYKDTCEVSWKIPIVDDSAHIQQRGFKGRPGIEALFQFVVDSTWEYWRRESFYTICPGTIELIWHTNLSKNDFIQKCHGTDVTPEIKNWRSFGPPPGK